MAAAIPERRHAGCPAARECRHCGSAARSLPGTSDRYGGYAALAGVALESGVYRCAISYAGIADLKEQLLYEHKRVYRRYWDREISLNYTQDSVLSGVSPIKHIDAIGAPVLLIHGDSDTIVPIEQGQDMFDAMRRAHKDVQLVVAGPAEIEKCIEDHPDVEECAVIGVDHPELGQTVKAVIVPRLGHTIDVEAVRAFCAAQLAYYKVPERWEVREGSLPRNAAGKILKGEAQIAPRIGKNKHAGASPK